jgi:hypothetical protein
MPTRHDCDSGPWRLHLRRLDVLTTGKIKRHVGIDKFVAIVYGQSLQGVLCCVISADAFRPNQEEEVGAVDGSLGICRQRARDALHLRAHRFCV